MRTRSLFLSSLVMALLVGCSDGDDNTTNQTNAGGVGGASGQGGAGSPSAGQGGAGAGQGGAGQGGAGQGGAGQGGAGQGGQPQGGAGTAGVGGQPSAGQGGESGASGQSGASGAGAGGTAGNHLEVEQWGTRVRGAGLAVRRSGRSLWLGTRALPDPYDGKLRGGLERLNLDTGEVEQFESELPEGDYDGQKGPMATAEALDDGDRSLIVGREGLLVLKDKKFELKKIANGVSPLTMALDRAGGRHRLWVGTAAGLARLDADTFEQEKFYPASTLGGQPAHVAIDPATGAAYAVGYDNQGSSQATRVLDDAVSTFKPGENGVEEGTLGEVVFSAKAGGALFALGSWSAKTGGVVRWDGTSVKSVATEGQLAKASIGEYGAFGASVLTVDEEAGLLIVGGRIRPTGPLGGLEGGGLVWLDLATGHLAGLSMGRDGLPGDHVTSLTYDPQTRRAHALLAQPCNELKLGNKGLVSISFRDGTTPRYERPILSGVRSLVKQGDRMLVGLRDDTPGLSCDGYPIQTGLYELHGNRSGELLPLASETGEFVIAPDAGPTALAARGDELAVGTWRDGGMIGPPSSAFFFNPTTYGPSLYMLDVAWQGDAVWIAGRATHQGGDPPSLADIGPFGAALLTLSGHKVTGSTHYVRKAKNPGPIEGLPSSEVRVVLPQSDGSTLLVCATERVTEASLDRSPRKVFAVNGETRTGGVASVNGKTVKVLTEEDGAPDPRAAAMDGSAVVLLDATKGALRLEGTTLTPFALPAAAPDKAIPQSLWIGASGLVAGYDSGAVVQLGGLAKFVDGLGYVWRATERAPGVVVLGSDEGLVRVRLDSTGDTAEKPAGAAVLPTFVAIPPVDGGGGGQCLQAGESCQGMPDACCPGLSCGGSGFVLSCK